MAGPLAALDNYVLVNGGLSYGFAGWEARINVNNIFDKRYYPDACCITRVTPANRELALGDQSSLLSMGRT